MTRRKQQKSRHDDVDILTPLTNTRRKGRGYGTT